jgi:hypothetical protein
VLYQHAFNPARPAEPGSAAAQILDWAQQASLSIGCLSEPAVLRTALEAVTSRLDGSRAAGQPGSRQHCPSANAPSCTARSATRQRPGCCRTARWTPSADRYRNCQQPPAPWSWPALPRSALLDAVARTQPEMTAFFGCLYYAALSQEEAVALRLADCHLSGSGWGMLRLAAATPRTTAAWTNSGTSHEQRGLKHRPDGAIRMVPVPPVLAATLRAHVTAYGTAPDGRLFHGTRGGPLSESPYAPRRLPPRPRHGTEQPVRQPVQTRPPRGPPDRHQRGRHRLPPARRHPPRRLLPVSPCH